MELSEEVYGKSTWLILQINVQNLIWTSLPNRRRDVPTGREELIRKCSSEYSVIAEEMGPVKVITVNLNLLRSEPESFVQFNTDNSVTANEM